MITVPTTATATCDRCRRETWCVPLTEVEAEHPPDLVLRSRALELDIRWQDLCARCRVAVRNGLLRLAGRAEEVETPPRAASATAAAPAPTVAETVQRTEPEPAEDPELART